MTSKLSYIDSGQGTPLVFIHGFCGSKDYWQDVIPLLESKRRVIALDLRGHGDTEPNGKEYEIEDLAQDVHQLTEELGLTDFYLFGHSLGGYITLAYAEAYPEKLAGISLIHSTAFPDDEKCKEGRLQAAQSIKENGVKSFVEGLVPKLFVDKESADVERAIQIGLNTSASGAVGALGAMRRRKDRNDVLKQAKVPVLLVAGEKDEVISSEKTFSVHGPLIKEVVLKESGHMGMFEETEKLAEEILAFTE